MNLTRRSIMALFGLAPVAPALASIATQKADPELKDWRIPFRIVKGLPPNVQRLIRSHDPASGDMGRGHQIPIEKMLEMVPVLYAAGFSWYSCPDPIVCPLRTADEIDRRFFAVYGATGKRTDLTWWAFVREKNGKSEVVAFECDSREGERFYAKTGLSLFAAIKGIS